MVAFPLLFLTFDTVNHISCCEALSCLWEVNDGHSFSSPGSRSFPMGSFQISEFGLPLFSFMLSLWDLSQISHSYTIPKSVTPSLTMLLPTQPHMPYKLMSFLFTTTFWTVPLDVILHHHDTNIFWNWTHHLYPQHWLFFLICLFSSMGNQGT